MCFCQFTYEWQWHKYNNGHNSSEILQMFRKSESRVIHRLNSKYAIRFHILAIHIAKKNNLFNKLRPHGRTKIQTNFAIVTANISDFTYSAITIGVKLIHGRKSHRVFYVIRIFLLE